MYQIDHRAPGERDAYKLLYAAFIAAPIIAGVDKFTDKLGDWDRYLADGVAERQPNARLTESSTSHAEEERLRSKALARWENEGGHRVTRA